MSNFCSEQNYCCHKIVHPHDVFQARQLLESEYESLVRTGTDRGSSGGGGHAVLYDGSSS